jgi:hypothetical protein
MEIINGSLGIAVIAPNFFWLSLCFVLGVVIGGVIELMRQTKRLHKRMDDLEFISQHIRNQVDPRL